MANRLLEASRILSMELGAAFRRFLRDAFSSFKKEPEKEPQPGVAWYSGTWCIKGCPNCPCRIEYVSFVAAYDTKAGKWIKFETNDVCPSCGTHLIHACLAPDSQITIEELKCALPTVGDAKKGTEEITA